MSTIREKVDGVVEKVKKAPPIIEIDFSEEARDEEMKGRVPYAHAHDFCEWCYLYHKKSVPLPKDRICKEKDCPGCGRVQPKQK